MGEQKQFNSVSGGTVITQDIKTPKEKGIILQDIEQEKTGTNLVSRPQVSGHGGFYGTSPQFMLL